MALRGILFDFNGTLFFDSEYHLRAFRHCFRSHGLPVPSDAEMIRSVFGRNNETIYRERFHADADSAEIARFAAKKEELYRQNCLAAPERFRLVDGAEQLLDFLKANNIPCCIATGAGLDNVTFYQQHLSLGRWFPWEHIVYTDGTYPGKPAPDIYRIAAARLGLSPAECLVFEDGTSGILAARVAGAGAVVALWEERLPSPLTDEARADRVIHNLLDWKNILAEFGFAGISPVGKG